MGRSHFLPLPFAPGIVLIAPVVEEATLCFLVFLLGVLSLLVLRCVRGEDHGSCSLGWFALHATALLHPGSAQMVTEGDSFCGDPELLLQGQAGRRWDEPGLVSLLCPLKAAGPPRHLLGLGMEGSKAEALLLPLGNAGALWDTHRALWCRLVAVNVAPIDAEGRAGHGIILWLQALDCFGLQDWAHLGDIITECSLVGQLWRWQQVFHWGGNQTQDRGEAA